MLREPSCQFFMRQQRLAKSLPPHLSTARPSFRTFGGVQSRSNDQCQYQHQHTRTQNLQRRSYFTNGDAMKKTDPYAILGLNWGDGATTSDIRAAFRDKARLLHPDVNKIDSPDQALKKFQALQQAYEQIVKSTTTGSNGSLGYVPEEWRAAIWRQGDRIAMDRTDVAGVLRKRPAQPAVVSKEWQYGGRNLLGHPSGRGIVHQTTRGEYLSAGSSNGDRQGGSVKRPSSVGRGLNKWVTPKEFKPWNPDEEEK
jgi:hypothetical protein